MNQKDIENKIQKSIYDIKNSDSQLQSCLGKSINIGNDSTSIMFKDGNLEKCSNELQKSIAYLCYVVWENFCKDSSPYNEVLKKLDTNKKFNFEVYKIAYNQALINFKVIDKNGYSVNFYETIEDNAGNFATSYCSSSYTKTLGFYDEFVAESNESTHYLL